MGIGRIFDISRRSLATYQRALDVTAHNISNAANPNYTRQRVNFISEQPDLQAGFVWGAGVRIDQLQRVRNTLADAQLRSATPSFYENQSKSAMLGQVEAIFNEPSDAGVSNLMNSFFNSWSQLTVSPNSASLRTDVVHSAERLSAKVNNIHSELDQMRSDILTEYKTKVSQLNSNLKNLQSLNSQIVEFKAVGNSASDIEDQRDAILDNITKLANVNIQLDTKGSTNLSIGGVYAADSSNYVEFQVGTKNGILSIVAPDGTAPTSLNSGELNALSNMYSEKIPGYLTSLDNVISQMMTEVNTLHSSAYTLGETPETGINFFDSYLGGELKINKDILDSPNMIAVSSDGSAGNGDVAVSISEIGEKKIFNGQTLSEYYQSFISGLGNDKITADETAASNDSVLQQLEAQKSSYSGVSIDEEMTNVIRFQRSYDASAKLIKVADEMLQTIIQMV
ncbi:MAG: flagellar hook-associated protein FlgK [Ignavibacteriaceae bacterium]|nr:flagellar hook-associated protein FlgK [Ignavibacteriaceae bacterium]